MQTVNSKTTPNKLRKRPWFVLLLAIGFAVTGLCIYLSVMSLSRPYIGANLKLDNQQWVVQSLEHSGLAHARGIEQGDIVISVNGQEPADFPQAYIDLKVISSQLVEQLSIDSNGETIKLSVHDSKIPSANIQETVILSIISLLFLSVGFFVFIKKKMNNASTVFYLVSMVAGLEFLAGLAQERALFLSFELQKSVIILLPWLVAHFFWIFPSKKKWLSRLPHAEYLLYVPFIIMVVLFLAGGHSAGQTTSWFGVAYAANLALGLLFSLGLLLHSYITATFIRVRQQTKIIFIGMLLAVLPILLLVMLPNAINGTKIVPVRIASLTLLFSPLSIGYTIVRYQLMDIDLLIKRSIVYGLMTTGLMIIYGLTGWGLYEIMNNVGNTSLTVVVVFFFAVIAALSYRPIIDRLQGWVDHTLYKDRYDYKKAIRAISLGFSATTDMKELSQFLIVSTTQTLGLSAGCLLMPGKSESGLSVIFATGRYEHTETQKKLVKSIPALKENDMFPNQAPLDSNAAFFIPLRAGKTEVGLLCLDGKISRAQFSADDLLFLHTLASEAAITLQSSRLLREVRSRDKELEKAYHELEKRAAHLEESKVEQEKAYQNLVENKKQLEESYLNMARTLVLLQESRDRYTGGHSKRVAQFARAMGTQLGLNEAEMRAMELAANLHDIAKIAIPDRIFQKDGPLDPQEKTEVQLHPSRAVELLRFLDFMEDALPIIEHHHEWYNGSGYPHGLKGDNIPLGARILAVIDTFDAMTSDRPYRSALTADEAVAELRTLAGAQWDPAIVESFISAIGMDKDTSKE
ncbi:MAG: HD domain-containing protein [Chloroflexi bacterium]|jgi:HD-GYP domain-containing protein (c-di-GMP phosphodiesterase class II)|nr:HD domain-containing protein [Chloroflexota bacterium]MBT7081098.1 HD domain-containing protein [Chloroflexota bacterium]MBT7289466.1 HD domain-containing protein [Chloroflexota bacterium]